MRRGFGFGFDGGSSFQDLLEELMDDPGFGGGDILGGRRKKKDDDEDEDIDVGRIIAGMDLEDLKLMGPVTVNMDDDYAKMALENMQYKRGLDLVTRRSMELVKLVLRREDFHHKKLDSQRVTHETRLLAYQKEARGFEAAAGQLRSGHYKAQGRLFDLLNEAKEAGASDEFIEKIESILDVVIDAMAMSEWAQRNSGYGYKPDDPRPTPRAEQREQERLDRETAEADDASSTSPETLETASNEDTAAETSATIDETHEETHEESPQSPEENDGKTTDGDHNDNEPALE